MRESKEEMVFSRKGFKLIDSEVMDSLMMSERASLRRARFRVSIFSASVSMFFIQWFFEERSAASRFALMAAIGVLISWEAFAMKIFWVL